MPKLVSITPVAGNLYLVAEVSRVDPGFGVGGGTDPDYGVGHPRPPRPDHELPHLPGLPDNTLPSGPPPHVPAGVILVLVRTAEGLWKWATLAPGSPPPV